MKLRWLVVGLMIVAVLVPAGMISSARLLEVDGGRWIRLVAFTTYAVPLYALALLLLLLVVVARRGFWRGAAGSVCVLLLPLLAVHLWWAGGAYVGQPAASAAGAGSVTVMASNLFEGRADPARLVQTARANDVDVLVLTEVTGTAVGRLEDAGLTEAYPHSAGDPAPGVEGTMVFSTRKVRDVRALGTTFGGWAVTLRLAGEPVRLFAVHPHPPTGQAREWRVDHAAIRNAVAGAEGPTVIAGDFNATLDHRPMRELRGRGFVDAAAQADSGWQPTWPASGERSMLGVPVPSLLAIDHVLVSEELLATRTETVTVPGTDHRALVARLRWR